jgi:cyanophycinase
MSDRRQAPGPILAIPGQPGSIPGAAGLSQFLQLAGGSAAVIAILCSAATNPAGTGQAYAARLRQLGAREARWLPVWQRCDANSAEVVAALQRATGIFVADGDRARLQRLLAETEAISMILRRHREGAVVAGINAEAAGPDAVRLSALVELGIGVDAIAELVTEPHLSYAVEWSAY